jgi:HEAT repeat protein
MTDDSAQLTPTQLVARRFARLVEQLRADPAGVALHRKEVRGIAKALRTVGVRLEAGEGDALLIDGAAELAGEEAGVRLLASRLAAYGVEELTLAQGASEADLHDLARLLATSPDQQDPLAYFAARATSIDPKGIPRRLRARPLVEVPEAPEPTAEVDAVSKSAAPKRETAASAPAASDAADQPPRAALESAPSSADGRADQLTEALPLPVTTVPEIAGLFADLLDATDAAALRLPLEALSTRADLAFRAGRFNEMLEALAGLVSIEFTQLARDSSDERRKEFAQVVRRLASPVILRQLAGMRHRHALDDTRRVQLQAVLSRFGTAGAEALLDEYAVASTAETRARCLDALRGHQRTHDALFELVRDTRDPVVRQAATLLGALGDERAEALLVELVRHPDARSRRAAIAALERFASPASREAIGFALLDDEPTVRLRAVAALSLRGGDQSVRVVAPLLDTEPDREVRDAAVAALGRIGTPEAVQLLIRCAQGETAHPKRRSAAYRLQACRALVLVRTPQAMAAVQMLRDDRDREVRDGAGRLVAQAARRGTGTFSAL